MDKSMALINKLLTTFGTYETNRIFSNKLPKYNKSI
jgi:hypothetical protein